MQASLFSTYSTGENRVTGSILGVLKYLALGRIERLLGALLEESEFELVHFQNQPARGGQGIPDAVISSSCRILIETKIRRDAVNVDQLRRHLKRLDGREAAQIVLLLTTDEARPRELEALKDDKRLAWNSGWVPLVSELLGKIKECHPRLAFSARQIRTAKRKRSNPAVEECPTPGKALYRSTAEARAAMLVGPDRRPSLKAYRCRCGFWHLASDFD